MKTKDYLEAITWSNEPLMDKNNIIMGNRTVETEYIPFFINRWLSFHQDCIFYVNDLNQYPMLDKKIQFDYLRIVIPKLQRKSQQVGKGLSKTKRFQLKLIQHYYNYNIRKAKEALTILTPDQLAYIEKVLTEGTNWEVTGHLPILNSSNE